MYYIFVYIEKTERWMQLTTAKNIEELKDALSRCERHEVNYEYIGW